LLRRGKKNSPEFIAQRKKEGRGGIYRRLQKRGEGSHPRLGGQGGGKGGEDAQYFSGHQGKGERKNTSLATNKKRGEKKKKGSVYRVPHVGSKKKSFALAAETKKKKRRGGNSGAFAEGTKSS